MKNLYILFCLLLTSSLIGQDIIVKSLSWQEILVNEVKTDIPSISEKDIQEKFLSSIEADYGLYFVDLSLEEMEETKMTGIDSKTAILCDFTIRLYSLLDESLIGVKTIKLTGSGRSLVKARKSALKAIKRSKKKFNKFLEDKTKDLTTDCAKIPAAVDAYLSISEFKKAYAIASANVGECSNQQWALKQKVYDQYQDRYCDQHLIKVEAYLSTKEYKKAIREVINISPDSKCSDRLSGVIKDIKENYQKDYDMDFKGYLKYLETSASDRQDRKDIINLLLLKNIIND